MPIHQARGARQPKGFTLIELMVVIAMLAILLALAAPSFQEMRKNSQVTTLGNEFVMGAAFARGEAISRNQCVTMCMAADISAATPVCATAGLEWNVGWIIFANNKCDDNAADSTAELLKAYLGDPSGPSMAAPAADALRKVQFNSRGMAGSLTAKSSLSLTPAGESTATKAVCLDRTGRARVAKAGSIACGTNLN
ncbi:GspH/FimT family pseudopilin [Variovorax fucosicus]|uniref:GspH/FimT family pseudopilin n=1 Tax=Variovorax fucosicus TaxID=3053517 RepID=UPI0025752319|nr:GspH/FimT family protein [Variovorax sp. J22G47]MDM0054915.1 GspH/FimT family protein [Variovorax sp. J22G47]